MHRFKQNQGLQPRCNGSLLPRRKIIVGSKQSDFKDQIESLVQETPMPPHSIRLIQEIPEFILQCSQDFGCVGLVDMTSEPVLDEILMIHQFCLTGKEACLIAVIAAGKTQESLLFKIGFRGVIIGSQLSKIGRLANRYWDSVSWPPQNITELVISNLPWRAIE